MERDEDTAITFRSWVSRAIEQIRRDQEIRRLRLEAEAIQRELEEETI